MSEAPEFSFISDRQTNLVDSMSEQYAEAFERSVQAQSSLVDAWMDAVESRQAEDQWNESVDATIRAYEIWMDAGDRLFDRMTDVLAGEDIQFEEFRNIWLEAANRASSEVFGTSAFADVTGDSVEESFEAIRETDGLTRDLLHTWGLPSDADVDEVARRLIELERRQQSVETKLDRILEQMTE